MGIARRPATDRYQVRLRHGTLRRLHRASGCQAVRACSTPLSAAAGKKVTTIEGIGASKTGSAVQAAWVKIDVPQCGYCQSGQIMSACALLASKKAPSDADIDSAMSGNICRCGTYSQVREAIHVAAASLTTKHKAA